MKFLPVCSILWTILSPCRGEENPPPQWDVEIPGPIGDGSPAEPAPKPEPIRFEVLETRVQRREVTEASEIPGLPPVKGKIKITQQLVADPGLPDPPLPALPPDDPVVIARMENLKEEHQRTQLLFISATVYGHARTYLKIFPNGQAEGGITAWSNIDFNHFSGFSTIRVHEADGEGREYGILMGIGDEISPSPDEPKIPALPDLADNGPAFVVVAGPQDSPARDNLSQMHELYRNEGQRMEAAFIARQGAEAERKAFLLAHPPAPKDVTIQFWKRRTAPNQPQQGEESGE